MMTSKIALIAAAGILLFTARGAEAIGTANVDQSTSTKASGCETNPTGSPTCTTAVTNNSNIPQVILTITKLLTDYLQSLIIMAGNQQTDKLQTQDTGDGSTQGVQGFNTDQTTTGTDNKQATCTPINGVGACGPDQNNLFKNPFNKDSAFHRPIGTGATYASDTDPATLSWRQQNGMVLNVGKSWGFVIAEGKSADPLVTVVFDTSTPSNYGGGEGLPITLHIPPGLAGHTSDANSGIYDGATETNHEIYRFYDKNGQYTGALARQNSARGLGHTPPGQKVWAGASASGMSEFLTTLRGFEVNTPGYKIHHALNFIVFPTQSSKNIAWPAVSRDGYCRIAKECAGNIPYGALLAIPPESKGGPNLDSLGLSEPGKRVAEAIRDYGMYLYDTGGSVAMRTDQEVSSTVATQVKADLTKLYSYIYMVKNATPDQTIKGGGDPLAPNCGFDAK